MNVFFAPFRDEKDKPNGVVVVIQDMTKQAKLDDMRKEFVANVSHELKTPLTSIKTYTETLLDQEIDEEGKYRNKTIIYPEGPEECRHFFSKRNPHAHPAVLFRKSFFDKLKGKKYRPEYRQNQDTMLWYDGMMAGTQHANIPDVVLNFRMTNAMFKKRRNGWEFATKQFKDRLMINKKLGYNFKADIYGFAMFCILVSPVWIKKIAYKVLR